MDWILLWKTYLSYNILYIHTPDVHNSWFNKEVNEEDYNKFMSELKKASRDTKLKRLNGYFKHSEEHYSRLHSKN